MIKLNADLLCKSLVVEWECKTLKHYILFLKIWTNGNLTLKEALHEASKIFIDLFISFLCMVEEILHLEDNKHMILLFPFTLHDKLANLWGKKHLNVLLLNN